MGVDHHRFFLLHLPFIFLTASVAFVGMFLLFADANQFRPPMAIILPVSLLIGYLCCMGTLGVTLVGATIVGLYHSLREKRNLLRGAMQVASYLAGFLTLWAVFGALLILGIRALDEAKFFDMIRERWGINRILAFQFATILPNAAVGIWFLMLLSRGTTATRYANK